MPDSEVERVRDSLYAMVESTLDIYLENLAKIDLCQKQSSIVESPAQGKAQKDTDSIVRSTDAVNTPV